MDFILSIVCGWNTTRCCCSGYVIGGLTTNISMSINYKNRILSIVGRLRQKKVSNDFRKLQDCMAIFKSFEVILY